MALHRLDSITLGVPDLEATGEFYVDFGLQPSADGTSFSTVDAGEQLHLRRTPIRRLLRASFACDDADDVLAAKSRLDRLGVACHVHVPSGPTGAEAIAVEPGTGVEIELRVAARTVQQATPASLYNGPGRFDRVGERSPAVVRVGRVRPRRLGHFVLGTPDYEASYAFFVTGLGFRVSDYVKNSGAFLRCSTDHHNVLIQRSPAPFLHHTSWQVEDIDEIGRGATHMLEADPQRHVWGLGRHFAGSNFFWYLRDPSGTFAEYHSDMDCIPTDAMWTPDTLEGARGLFQWGPPPPASFLHPEDLADLMIAGHT